MNAFPARLHLPLAVSLLPLVLLWSGGCGVNRSAPAAPAAPAKTSATSTNGTTPGGNSPADIATEYDLVYAITHGHVSLKPSPFLMATVQSAGTPPAGATALDIGSGNGRNALYMARQGYRVTGVDLSHIGVDLTRQAAAADRLPVTAVAADINAYPIGSKRWNLITLIDFPFPYKKLLPRIAAGLKPGGIVVIQEVSSKQTGLTSPDHNLIYTFMNREDLDAPFAGFTVLHNTEGEQPTAWGVRAIMVRYVARKPEAAH